MFVLFNKVFKKHYAKTQFQGKILFFSPNSLCRQNVDLKYVKLLNFDFYLILRVTLLICSIRNLNYYFVHGPSFRRSVFHNFPNFVLTIAIIRVICFMRLSLFWLQILLIFYSALILLDKKYMCSAKYMIFNITLYYL